MSASFPILNSLNENRIDCFNKVYDNETSYTQKALNFGGHKLYTIITLPANVLGTGVGFGGAAICAGTMGVVKVATFALTLGNVRITTPTGTSWFAERGITALSQIGKTLYEVSYDVYRGVAKLAEFVFNRIAKGVEKALEIEAQYAVEDVSVPLISRMNEYRNQFTGQDRTGMDILKHSMLSVVTIPVNGAATLVTGATAALSAAAFALKVAVYAGTNLNIPVPVFPQVTADAAFQSIGFTVSNSGRFLVDIPTGLYRAVEATGLFRAAATIPQMLAYIPQAMFRE